ncbi:MAG: nucleotidyltransferase [Methylobacterium radiotolerans]
MSVADAFRSFLGNIKITNGLTISTRYGEITAALNKKFRDTESKTANSLQVGSYGRHTAIKGVSDLDMLYIMPAGTWSNYKDGGQYRLLSDCAAAIEARYPSTTVKVDRLVVRVLYLNFHIEVQPVFEQSDSSYKYPDSYKEGSWKITKPRDELKAMMEFNAQKNDNLRRLARMARAWKNKHGVAMGGLLIDTLAYNFLKQTDAYDGKSYLYYDWMSRDFFAFLMDQPKQDYYAALGSGQRVKVKKDFRRKAKKAYELCLKAIEAETQDYRNDRWRKVFGSNFPPRPVATTAADAVMESVLKSEGYEARNTERFIEDMYPIDIRFDIELECEVKQDGFRPSLLRSLLAASRVLQARKDLKFFVADTDVPQPFTLLWKVLNRGPTAVRRDCIRGEIVPDNGRLEKIERTNFRGDHIVECYAVKDGVVVAKDRIHVPITE